MAGETEQRETRILVADPSALTTQQLWREIQNLKELLETRISSIEKSIEVAHEDLVRVPTDVQKQVGNLKELHEEKFRSIEVQFRERDVRVEQTSRDTKTAVDAALAAQEKAVGKQNESFSLSTAKSEESFTKQIDALFQLLQTNTKSIETQIGELKDRLNRGEGRGEGTKETKTTQQDTNKYVLAVLALIFTIVAFFIGRGGL